MINEIRLEEPGPWWYKLRTPPEAEGGQEPERETVIYPWQRLRSEGAVG